MIAIKTDDLKNLNEEYQKKFSDKEVVFGEGNHDAKIVLIGEAPGKEEVLQKKPFVGAAGKKLTEFMELANLDRKDVYVTNAIKYRLFEINMITEKKRNRPAKLQEITENQQFLFKEIEIIKPEYIITLGNIPLRSITNEFKNNIGDNHGLISRVTINNHCLKLYPLYHPASVIYNNKLIQVYNEDIKNFKKIYEAK